MRLHKRLDRHDGRRFFGGGSGNTGGGIYTILKELSFCNNDGDQTNPDLIGMQIINVPLEKPGWAIKPVYHSHRKIILAAEPKREYSEEDLVNIRETLLQWRPE